MIWLLVCLQPFCRELFHQGSKTELARRRCVRGEHQGRAEAGQTEGTLPAWASFWTSGAASETSRSSRAIIEDLPLCFSRLTSPDAGSCWAERRVLGSLLNGSTARFAEVRASRAAHGSGSSRPPVLQAIRCGVSAAKRTLRGEVSFFSVCIIHLPTSLLASGVFWSTRMCLPAPPILAACSAVGLMRSAGENRRPLAALTPRPTSSVVWFRLGPEAEWGAVLAPGSPIL